MSGDWQALNVCGLQGPVAVMKVRRALIAMREGTRVEVRADDYDCMESMAAFCFNAGHRLVMAAEEDKQLVFRIERGPDLQASA